MTKKINQDEFDVKSDFKIFTEDRNKIGITASFDEALVYNDRQFIDWYTGTANMIIMDNNSSNQKAQIRLWCLANCQGPVAYHEMGNYWSGQSKIYFFFQEDAMAFKLRWIN